MTISTNPRTESSSIKEHSPIQRLNLPPRSIRPLIPTLRQRKQRNIPLLLHALRPIGLNLSQAVQARNALLRALLDALLDPLGLELRAAGSIAEGGRRLRAVQEEHVWEHGDRDAHAGPRAVLPVVGDGFACCAADVELCERTVAGVEVGGEDEDVEFFEAFFVPEAVLGDFDDGGFLYVDDLDVFLAHDFVVVLLQGWTLRALWMGWVGGREDLGFLGVGDSLADFPLPEFVGFIVGFLVEEHVFVGVEPEAEATLLPELLVLGFALLWGLVKGLYLVEVVGETGECAARGFEHLVVVAGVLLLLLLLRVECVLTHWQAEVGCAEENREVLDFWADFLRYFDA